MELFLPGPAAAMNPLLPMYARLWSARMEGPEVLHRALEESVRSDLPWEREQILMDLESSRFFSRRAPEGQVRYLSAYRRFMPLPYDQARTMRRFVRDRLLAYTGAGLLPGMAYAAGLLSSFSACAIMSAIVLGGGLIAADLAHYRRNGRNMLSVAEAMRPGSDAPDVAVFLMGALNAAFERGRSAEVHYLALAAGHCYGEGSCDTPEGLVERSRLMMMAQIRGSHHAAHALWLIRQETGLSDGDLGSWPYDPLLVGRSLYGEVAAQETVNLAIRESVDFRTGYIADMRHRHVSPERDANLRLALEMASSS